MARKTKAVQPVQCEMTGCKDVATHKLVGNNEHFCCKPHAHAVVSNHAMKYGRDGYTIVPLKAG